MVPCRFAALVWAGCGGIVTLNLVASEGIGSRPNVVVILADDLSRQDVGAYGGEHNVTPNIDRLASEGLCHDRAWTPVAMCAPSRSSLFTGLHPARNGAMRNHSGINPGIITLPSRLNSLGYATALVGKSHVGPDEAFPWSVVESKSDRVTKVLEKLPEPFCLIFASHAPHPPFKSEPTIRPESIHVPPNRVDTPAERNLLRGYLADVRLFDNQVGIVMQALKQSGRAGNTIVIVTSDHGAGVLAKWSCYEAGLGVPFVVRWPGVVPAGTRTNALISFVDFVPTMIQLAGGEPPGDSVDGRSLLPLWQGKTDTHHEYLFGCHTNLGIHHGKPYPIRSVRDDRYHYIRNLAADSDWTSMVTHEKDGALKSTGPHVDWVENAKTPAGKAQGARVLRRPPEELFDLESDPYELVNLADSPVHAETKQRLSDELDRWMAAQNDPGTDEGGGIKDSKKKAKRPQAARQLPE